MTRSRQKKSFIILFILLGCLVYAFGLKAGTSDIKRDKAVQTEWGVYIPLGAYGVVDIPAPMTGSLMMLQGIVGRGYMVMRDENETCTTSPIRLAAGNFMGQSIAVQNTQPIRLIIYSQRVAKALYAGNEVVSNAIRVTSGNHQTKGDIQLVSGLSPAYGFVLNPGEWSWSGLFGVTHQKIACRESDNLPENS